MPTRMRRALLRWRRGAAAVAVLSAACVHGRGAAAPRDCPPTTDTSRVTLDTTTAATLAGRYQVVSVNTVRGYGGYVSRHRLALAVPDPAHRVRARRPMLRRTPPPDTLLLAGRYEWEADGRVYGDTAEVLPRGMLVVGCVECLDASPTVHTIDALTADGFRGRWSNPQTGIGVIVDRRGRRLPNPGGYYCARRL